MKRLNHNDVENHIALEGDNILNLSKKEKRKMQLIAQGENYTEEDHLNYREELFKGNFEKAWRKSHCMLKDRKKFLENLESQEGYLDLDVEEIVEFLDEQDYIKNILPEFEESQPFCFSDSPDHNPYHADEGLDC